MKNNSPSCSNKQRGVAKIFNIRSMYMQKFFLRKFLLFAFLFLESKNLENWADGVSHEHSNREIKWLKLQKNLMTTNFACCSWDHS